MPVLSKIAAKCDGTVSNTEVTLTITNSGYMIARYTPTVKDIDLEKGFIEEPVEYEKDFS